MSLHHLKRAVVLRPALKRTFASSSIASSSFPVSTFSANGDFQVSQPKITVFGATGFLAQHIIYNFAFTHGCQVIAPYRGDGRDARHLKVNGELGQVVPVPFDLTSVDSIKKAVSKSDIVINCIGSKKETNNFNFDDVHVKIAYRIAKACKEVGVPRFFQTSSLGADPASSSRWLSSKALGDAAVQSFYPDATIFKLAPLFGIDDSFLYDYASQLHHLGLVPVVDGYDPLLQPASVVDAARAIANAAISPLSVGKTYEIAGPQVISQSDLIRWICSRIYRTYRTIEIPEAVLKLISSGVQTFVPHNYRFTDVDQVQRMKLNFVATPGSLGFADLGVDPKSVEEAGGSALAPFVADRGPLRPDIGLKLDSSKILERGDINRDDRTSQYR